MESQPPTADEWKALEESMKDPSNGLAQRIDKILSTELPKQPQFRYNIPEKVKNSVMTGKRMIENGFIGPNIELSPAAHNLPSILLYSDFIDVDNILPLLFYHDANKVQGKEMLRSWKDDGSPMTPTVDNERKYTKFIEFLLYGSTTARRWIDWCYAEQEEILTERALQERIMGSLHKKFDNNDIRNEKKEDPQTQTTTPTN